MMSLDADGSSQEEKRLRTALLFAAVQEEPEVLLNNPYRLRYFSENDRITIQLLLHARVSGEIEEDQLDEFITGLSEEENLREATINFLTEQGIDIEDATLAVTSEHPLPPSDGNARHDVPAGPQPAHRLLGGRLRAAVDRAGVFGAARRGSVSARSPIGVPLPAPGPLASDHPSRGPGDRSLVPAGRNPARSRRAGL